MAVCMWTGQGGRQMQQMPGGMMLGGGIDYRMMPSGMMGGRMGGAMGGGMMQTPAARGNQMMNAVTMINQNSAQNPYKLSEISRQEKLLGPVDNSRLETKDAKAEYFLTDEDLKVCRERPGFSCGVIALEYTMIDSTTGTYINLCEGSRDQRTIDNSRMSLDCANRGIDRA